MNPTLQEFKKQAQEFYDRMAIQESEELAEEATWLGHMVSTDSSELMSHAGRLYLEGSQD
jgi:hypothetical protein